MTTMAMATEDASRPTSLRRATDPASEWVQTTSGSASLRGGAASSTSHARSHVRAKSSAGIVTPPHMTRAKSAPLVDTLGRVTLSSQTTTPRRPSSPLSSTSYRPGSPSKRSFDEGYGINSRHMLPEIGEDSTDLVDIPEDQPTKPLHSSHSAPVLPLSPKHHSLGRRHRTSSPLRNLVRADEDVTGPQTDYTNLPLSASPTPLMSSNKYNEAYPSTTSFLTSLSTTSSVPSTPTTARSRSPSISSLETIPDSPGAEEAALEAERIAELKAAADAEDQNDQGDSASYHGRGSSKGFALSITWVHGARDKRKRWSVCGAERRSDLDLETIWED